MFETLPNPSLEVVLIAGRAVLLLGAFWIFALAFIRWRRSDELLSASLQAQVERTFAEVRSLHETISVMSARLEALSERAEQDARLPPVSTGSAQRGYEIATRLARNGADASEIMANCGLTRHEAELLLRLQGGSPRQAASVVAPRAVPAANPRMPSPRPTQTRERDEPADTQAQREEEREMLTRAPAPTGRQRGSLLSVVG
jgi:hypothetical protein